MPWIKLFKFVVWINTLTAETRFIQRIIWCWLCLKECGRTFYLQARLDICNLKILSSHIWTLYTHWICYFSIITKMVLILICLYSLYLFTIFNDFLIFIWNTTYIWIKIIFAFKQIISYFLIFRSSLFLWSWHWLLYIFISWTQSWRKCWKLAFLDHQVIQILVFNLLSLVLSFLLFFFIIIHNGEWSNKPTSMR